ncbi:hypothetical protein HHI36_019988 [Cryptolaemus montrouzieri]|uniref:U6 snRNA phosphodiesterase n=1 Tax=Cryptolaemus montrouzieri TaxID=559131 RepID=A0ABD2N9L8_9CUCU
MSRQNSLQLLADYGNDGESSDEDVPGSRVSTKRVFKEEGKQLRLPVPDCLSKVEISSWEDKPSEHQGRVRSFQHERGNWATFIYIPYQSHYQFNHIIDWIIDFVPEVSLNKVEDFHISLTRTVILKYHWIFPFMNTVKENTCNYSRFIAMFGDFRVYCNEERTRTFIGLEIKTGRDTLRSLVKDLDKCLLEFKLPQFYEDPSFHMSIVWCLGDMEEKLCKYLPQLNSKLQEIIADYPDENWYILANYLFCKTGNKMFQFPLV